MLRPTALLTALAVPAAALAITIAPADYYNDVRPTSPEAAGINLLTSEGIVEGYGERQFGPSRLVNRAEFLKIAMLSLPEGSRPALGGDTGCFPDVPAGQWFTPYVCAAKDAGVVKGNPDGTFRPERTVQYDEALKMLTILFGYEIPASDSPDWGEPYYLAAAERGTDLPVRITLDAKLSRAWTARLAAAFVAEFHGELQRFRLAEAGEYAAASSSSVSSSAASESSSSSSSVSSSASSSVPAALFTLPPVPHFLVAGRASDAIASGVIRPSGEDVQVSIVQVKLYKEVRSIDRLELVTEDGQLVATLLRRITTDIPEYKETFDAQVNSESRFTLPKDADTKLVLRAVIRGVDNGGFSDELLQVRTFNVTVVGKTTNQNTNIPLAGPFPKHQTSLGRIVSVRAVSPVSAPVIAGTGITLGSFSLSGSVHSTRSISITALTFALQQTGQVTHSNLRVVRRDSGASAPCTVNMQAMTVSCTGLGALGLMKQDAELLFDLKSDIWMPAGATNVSYSADLAVAGSPEALGAVEWTDGSAVFRWIESAASPVAAGTRFR